MNKIPAQNKGGDPGAAGRHRLRDGLHRRRRSPSSASAATCSPSSRRRGTSAPRRRPARSPTPTGSSRRRTWPRPSSPGGEHRRRGAAGAARTDPVRRADHRAERPQPAVGQLPQLPTVTVPPPPLPGPAPAPAPAPAPPRGPPADQPGGGGPTSGCHGPGLHVRHGHRCPADVTVRRRGRGGLRPRRFFVPGRASGAGGAGSGGVAGSYDGASVPVFGQLAGLDGSSLDESRRRGDRGFVAGRADAARRRPGRGGRARRGDRCLVRTHQASRSSR